VPFDRRLIDIPGEDVPLLGEPGPAGFVAREEPLDEGRIVDPVHPHVDHHRPLPHVLAPKQARPAEGRDQEVGLPADPGEVAGAGMAEGDGAVGGEQERRHRLADDVAAADDHRPAARELDFRAPEQLHHPGRGGGDETARLAAPEAPDVDRVEAVHVLLRSDALQHPAGVEVGGQRQLDEEAVDLRIAVEGVHGGLELSLRGRGGERHGAAGDPHLGAGPRLRGDVDPRSGVVAHQQGGEAGGTPVLLLEGGRPGGDFGANLIGDRLAGEDPGHGGELLVAR